MAGTVTFILKDPKSKTKTPIYLVYWYNQFRIKISTGEKIKAKFWNQETHRARETKFFLQWDNLNVFLNSKQIEVENRVRDHLTENKTIITDKLKQELIEVLRPTPKTNVEIKTFFSAIEEYISTTNKTHKTKLSYGTTKNILKEYQKTLPHELAFESINMEFYDGFVNFLANVKNFTKNTIGTYIKNLKIFMNYSLDKGYTDCTGHLNRKFRKIEETAETIYLNDEELTKLYNLKLMHNPKLERVRDLFIIGCYTGLRFSDLSQLTPDNIIKSGTQIKIKTIKTGETVIIPVHWTIKEILKRYNGMLPRAISNQKMNEYLKDVGELAELNEKVILTKTKGGLDFEKTYFKYNLITVHTARRSFATNMFLAEVPTISIMKITGHRTERAFMKYIKITSEQNADKLSSHPYFTKSPLKVVNQ